MFYALVWWLLLVLIGFAALPVTLRFLRFLPDRGYAFAKPLGLLVWGYPFWLLTAFGFLQNSFGVLAAMLIAVAVVSCKAAHFPRATRGFPDTASVTIISDM